MSFYGKKFKKVSAENITELLEKIGLGEKFFGLLRQTGTVSVYEKNADGSIQFIATRDGQNIINQKFVLGKEEEFKSPTGTLIKATSTLEGDNVLKTTLSLGEGKEFHLDRHFQGNSMKMDVYVPGVDIKAVVHYEVVS